MVGRYGPGTSLTEQTGSIPDTISRWCPNPRPGETRTQEHPRGGIRSADRRFTYNLKLTTENSS